MTVEELLKTMKLTNNEPLTFDMTKAMDEREEEYLRQAAIAKHIILPKSVKE